MFYSIDEIKKKLGISLRDAYRLVHSEKIALLYKIKMPRFVDDLEPAQGEDGRTVVRPIKVIQGFKESMTLLPPEYIIKLITGDGIFVQDDVLTQSSLNEKTLLNEHSIFITERDFNRLSITSKPSVITTKKEELTKDSKQYQREEVLSRWLEKKGLQVAKQMTREQIHEELKKFDRLFLIASSTFNDFWKKQKLITLDAGKR